jgi:hypothetical protein
MGELLSVALFGVVFVGVIIAKSPSTGSSTLLPYAHLEVISASRSELAGNTGRRIQVNRDNFWVGIGWVMMVAIVTLALVAASWPIVGELSQLAAVLNHR